MGPVFELGSVTVKVKAVVFLVLNVRFARATLNLNDLAHRDSTDYNFNLAIKANVGVGGFAPRIPHFVTRPLNKDDALSLGMFGIWYPRHELMLQSRSCAELLLKSQKLKKVLRM
jgi:hypothetical protein